ADGIQAPAEFAAGTILLRASNQSEAYASVQFVQLPEGVTEADLETVLQPEAGIPEFAHESVMNGGAELDPGMTVEVAFDLTAGDWYLLNLSETPSIAPLTVTGDPVIVDIPATVDVEMSHHDFVLPADIAAGPAIWKFTNVDPVLHHMVLFSYPEAISEDDALAVLMAQEGMASPPAGIDPSLVGYAGGTALLSTDQVMYQEFDLAPATYFAVCFISDPGSDVPHVAQGMIEIFTVA
ncbi:MAG TPA: hypothetical protein VD767_04970, partial [Thermomicrobiales bacterium]|nr:hypothetical protein [Thermomicrobiales bacterium]